MRLSWRARSAVRFSRQNLLLLVPVLGIAIIMSGEALGQTAAFQIIVHPDNPTPPLTQEEISNLFLRRTTVWDHGPEVVPIDLEASSPTRDAFTITIHRRDVSNVETYWSRQVFAGQGSPPMTVASDSEVLALVRSNPQAVGYVSASASLDGVAVLRTIDQPPERTRFVEPEYTSAARRAHVSGIVVLRLRIDAEGNVEDVRVLEDLGFGLSTEAAKVARKWKYRPAMIAGQAVPTYLTVRLRFE
jgi:TonB family protein